MFSNHRKEVAALRKRAADAEAVVAAADRSQAVISFDLSGRVLTANDNFLAALGYSLAEIAGQPHSRFVDPAYALSTDYAAFWDRLRAGEFMAGRFERVGKGGRRVVIEASYNPIFDETGKPYKVVKFASDVTAMEDERRAAEAERAAASAAMATVVAATGGALARLADADLTARIDAEFPGDYRKLKDDFNAAMQRLEASMSEIAIGARAMRAGADEVHQAADNLSKRTEQQAATLEETAAALDQITATVRKTAEGAQQAGRAVTSARDDAERSGQVVSRAVQAMGDIESSSSQISQIIGVIDEIAFQTNLLALNAGVEAARAGDAGKGFAVVASEVRALAQRSAEAAKEIKTLISASSQQVKTGVTLVGETGTALRAIVDRVGEITGLMTEISASTQEQSAGLGQVNTAVNQMDQTTQQNAAMVEESTAAAHRLNQETEQLSQLVGRFRTSGQSGVTERPGGVRHGQARAADFARRYAG